MPVQVAPSVAAALHGTRAEEPAVTRARLEPLLERFGITRVARVTGLDRLGLPVYMAIRPNSRSLSVSQGKGLGDDAAWVSGVMEAIELWHAERGDVPLRLARLDEVQRDGRVLDLRCVPMSVGEAELRSTRMLWATGHDLKCGEPVSVPYSLVHTSAVVPFLAGDEVFAVSSNGLASGSCSAEATVHAMCELIERDAVWRWQRMSVTERAECWIDLDSIADATVRGLLDQCEAADFDVLACDARSPLGVPVVVCVLLDRHEPPDTLRGAAMGFGCHLRRDVAFVRALTEAAQSRLTLIAGSRDDLDRVDYEVHRRHRTGIDVYRQLINTPKRRPFADLPDHHHLDFSTQIDMLLDAMAGPGASEVVRVELADEAHRIAVVRVIAPALHGPDHGH